MLSYTMMKTALMFNCATTDGSALTDLIGLVMVMVIWFCGQHLRARTLDAKIGQHVHVEQN
eukprot:scaffold6260_cov129-Skeletonema_marinoi.AAC.4